MSIRVCHSVAGYGTCCKAAQQGRLGQYIPVTGPGGRTRCAVCTPITKRKGGQGFQFRFAKNANCGLAAGGCPVVGPQSSVASGAGGFYQIGNQ